MENNNNYNNLNLVLCYLLKGLSENRSKNLTKINEFFKIKNYNNVNNNLKESPFDVENTKIRSKINNITFTLSHEMGKENDKKNNNNISLAFTQKIKELLDIIHFAISTQTPLVLEGDYGQGKKSAIEYYAKISKLKLELISISKSTKIDDLLCKTIINKNEKGEMTLVNELTPLCEAIKCEENNPNQLIVIEGVSKASPSVLEILNNIYGKKGTEILLPNGSTIIKGNVLLISIFNPSDDFTKEKLPINMINNSI